MIRVAMLASALLLPSAAVAEIRFSGDARLGILHDSAAAAATRIEKRFTLNLDGQTATEAGVVLGARVRLRSEAGAGGALSGGRVFARAGGVTVAAGNIDGAIEKMPGIYVDGIGLTGLGKHGIIFNVAETAERDRHGLWDSFSSTGNGAEGIEASGTVGPVAFHVSYSADGLRGVVGPRERLAAHLAVKAGQFTLALGGQSSNADAEDLLGATVTGRFGAFDVGVGYGLNGGGAVPQIGKVALTLGVNAGAWRFDGYVANQSLSNAVVTAPTTWGIAAGYDLGGSARIVGGVEGTTRGTIRADLGATFRF